MQTHSDPSCFCPGWQWPLKPVRTSETKENEEKNNAQHGFQAVSVNLGEKAMVKGSHLSPSVRAPILAFSNLLWWNSPSEKSFLALVSCHVSNLKLLLSSRKWNGWNFCSFVFQIFIERLWFTSTVIDSRDSELSKIWPKSHAHRNSSLVGRQTLIKQTHSTHRISAVISAIKEKAYNQENWCS